MSEQPYELPPGFRVDGDRLLGPSGKVVANEYLVDGLWYYGHGPSGTGIDTHPLVRRVDHPTEVFGTYSTTRDIAITKGMGIRRIAFTRSLGLDYTMGDEVRYECWSLIDRGAMALYDEAAILRLVRVRLAKQCDRVQTQLAVIDEAIRART